MRLGLALLTVLLLPAAASAQTLSGEGTPIVATATEDDYARVVKQAVESSIVPSYAALDAATDRLVFAVEDLCFDTNPESRDGLASSFADTVKAWAGVDFLRFGPMARGGRYERFAYFPDVHGTGARQLRRFLASEDEGLLEPGALAGQSAAVQGLPALESLLYSGSRALLQTETAEPFRCALATAVAQNVDAIAGEALAEWQAADGWASLILAPGPDNPVYRTHAEAMTEILKAILTGLEQDRDQRLLPALGATPEEAKASRAPYNAAGQAIPYLAASADAIRRFVEASGILDLLPGAQKSYGSSALFEFSNLQNAFAAAGPDLEAALADPEMRSKLAYAAIVLQSLRDNFQRHISVGAGLTPGFNSMDGD
jgi:hypothetical protein